MPSEIADSLPPSSSANPFVWLSLVIALVASAGSVYLSVGMKLKACPLCFYQRAFVMGVAAVLIVGLFSDRRFHNMLNVLVLPMTLAGLGVAAFHVYLELAGRLECPKGVYGYGTAPQQSLAVYLVLLASVAAGVARSTPAGLSPAALPVAVVLGIVMAAGSIISSPPLPPVPTKAYETPLDICRPPFRASGSMTAS